MDREFHPNKSGLSAGVDFYIAGPMRGYPENNFPAFYACEDVLVKAGFTCVNPAKLDDEVNPNARYGSYTKADLAGFMARDIPYVMQCDAVMLLPGWHNSTGACCEAFMSWMTGGEVYVFDPQNKMWNALEFVDLLPLITRKMIMEELKSVTK